MFCPNIIIVVKLAFCLYRTTSKTKIVFSGTGFTFSVFKFGLSKLEVVPDYVYLGTTLNYNMMKSI